MLDIKGMARSTFYYGLKERPDKHAEVRKHIRRIYETHKGRYGYRRVQMELEAEGVHINHKTVQKLMNEMGLKGIRKKRKYKSYRGKVGHVAPNLLHRDFHAESPLQKCATDVTQIAVDGKWCYFSPVIDMFNGEIISYTISDRPNLKNVTVKLQSTSSSETCSITMYDVKFSWLMPVTLDVTIKPVTKKNGQITGNNIVPTHDGKRYEKYTVRQLKGTVSNTKLQFSCQMGSKRLTYEGKKK